MSLLNRTADDCWSPGVALLSVILLMGCERSAPFVAQGPSTPPTAPAVKAETQSCEQLMQPFVDALWGNDSKTLEAKLASPLIVVEQAYKLADAQPPYVLGTVKLDSLSVPEETRQLVTSLRARVGPQDGDLVPRPRVSADTAWDAAFVKNAEAADLRRCAITLAVGDTEHVLIAGFDRAGESIKAIYWN